MQFLMVNHGASDAELRRGYLSRVYQSSVSDGLLNSYFYFVKFG